MLSAGKNEDQIDLHNSMITSYAQYLVFIYLDMLNIGQCLDIVALTCELNGVVSSYSVFPSS